jgi:hypothetical protein
MLDQQRGMINGLIALSRGRMEDEARIKREHEESLRRAEGALQEAEQAAARALDESRGAAQRGLDQAVTRIEGQAGAALRAADEQRERVLALEQERAEAAVGTAKKTLDEAVWMAETVLESALPRAREGFEKTRKLVEEQTLLLSAIEQRAAAAVRLMGGDQAWWQSVPTTTAGGDAGVTAGAGATNAAGTANGASEAGASAEGSEELGERVKGAVEASARALRGVEAQPFIRAMRDAMIWLMLVLLLGGGAGVGAFLALPASAMGGAGRWWAAGAGAVAVGLVLVALRRWARGLLRARCERLAAANAAARAAAGEAMSAAERRRLSLERAATARRDLEVKTARGAFEAVRGQWKETLSQRRAAVEQEHAQRTRAAQTERDAALAEARAEAHAGEAEAERAFARAVREARAEHERAVREGERRRRDDDEALVSRWGEGLARSRALAGAHAASAGEMFAPWEDPRWSGEQPGWSSAVPVFVPFGRTRVDLRALPGGESSDPRLGVGDEPVLTLPAGLEFPSAGSLLVRFGGAQAGPGRAAALSLLRNTMLRLLTSFPPGKLRFTIIDPVGLGESFAAFMHLADYDAKLVGDKIWTEPRHIEARLADLTEHMENVIQKYLRNQFATIDEYNQRAGEIAEPYRFLVIADFPAGFSEEAARRLSSIAASGARCGVYTLMALDARQPLPPGVPEEDLARGAVCLGWRGDGAGAGALASDDAVLGAWPVELESPPADGRFNALVRAVGVGAKDASRVRVPFSTIAPAEGTLWTRESGGEVRVAMGRAGATRLQDLALGRGTAQHALIAGRTGSGKSTLLHAVITNLALWYSPDEIELYLVDFKKGVEFQTYARHALPHARVIAVESEREFGLSVLRRLDAELKRRGELFRAAGVQDVAGYRRAEPGARMPRTLLIVDEFQELFTEDDRLAQEASLLLDRLVRQGRAFGMHVLLGSQTLGGAYSLARSTIGQMAVRIALQCSEQDSYLIMGDDNAAPRLLSRPGEAIYNDASGAVEGNSPFQVAWLEDGERDALLERVREQARGRQDEPAIVFEGHAPAVMARCHRLSELLAGQGALPASPLAYLGEAIAIKDPTSASFRAQAGSNLLIVGQREEAATALLVAGVLALTAQRPRGRVLVLDGTPADAPSAGLLEAVAGALGPRASAVGYRGVEACLQGLSEELDRRQGAEEPGAAPAGPGGEPVFLVINGLQRFRALRRPENEFDFSADASASRPDQHLARLLRDGPALGVHVLAWCDTLAALNRVLDRQGLREFDQRVLFQMSAADSSALIDSPAAGQIGAHRALLYSEEQGTSEKFRPFALPDRAWAVAAAGALAGRQADAGTPA